MINTAAADRRAQTLKVDNASITWLESGMPYSQDFNDTYHSSAGAREESRYLFIEGNELEARWAQSQALGFTIAELGFGCALNFLQTLACWRQSKRKPRKLHYIAFEKHPLRTEDLARALALWPDLAPHADQLLTQYPEHSVGCHRLFFDDVCLDLHYGDACERLQALDFSQCAGVDAWYLDGFSPALNPELWDDSIATALRALSAPGATATSYSVAGSVRRALTQSGFSVSKRAGFAHKRHSLFACLGAAESTRSAETLGLPAKARVLVIGAGLAGCTTAASFLKRGFSVQLLDAAEEPLSAASGISQLALRPRIFQLASPQAAFFLQAFSNAQRLWRRCADSWHASGVLQFAQAMNKKSEQSADRLLEIYDERVAAWLSADAASEAAGIHLKEAALYFPEGGWVDTKALASEILAPWLKGDTLTITNNTEINQLSRNDSGQWEARSVDKCFTADYVVLCNSQAASSLLERSHLPGQLRIQNTRGQTSVVAPTKTSAGVSAVVCGPRSLFPALSGSQTIAASYSRDEVTAEAQLSAQEENLAGANTLFDTPQFTQELYSESAMRSAGEDFLPIIGPAPDVEQIESDFARLRRNAQANPDKAISSHRGLYLNIGHGSNGLASTPLSAEFIASLACGEPSPLSRAERECLEPARFILRAMKKQRN